LQRMKRSFQRSTLTSSAWENQRAEMIPLVAIKPSLITGTTIF
jgi:hypothetical protein